MYGGIVTLTFSLSSASSVSYCLTLDSRVATLASASCLAVMASSSFDLNCLGATPAAALPSSTLSSDSLPAKILSINHAVH